ncbi:MAG: hypothetical protein CSB55_03895 [Candidatus Cloacimonadota bacterium]|nr:MAG: hypothetical protein CSB55_03895 [Candidatus Cloacimonadota bacterium]
MKKAKKELEKIFEKEKLLPDPGKFKVTRNPHQIFRIIRELIRKEPKCGIDSINSFCSQSVKAENKSEYISFYLEDSDNYWQVKLKSAVIVKPDFKNPILPMIFIETDELPPLGEKTWIFESEKTKYQVSAINSTGNIFYEKEDILREAGKEVQPAKMIYRFLSSGMWGFFYVGQDNRYTAFSDLITNTGYKNMSEFKEMLTMILKNIKETGSQRT